VWDRKPLRENGALERDNRRSGVERLLNLGKYANERLSWPRQFVS
jgi:hypothetical protein